MGDIVGKALSGLIGGSSTRSAERRQSAATADANAMLQGQIDSVNEANAPALDLRNRALNQLLLELGLGGDSSAAGYGSLNSEFTGADLQNDPGYQFTRDEGMRGIRNDMAARGGLYSGATLKALDKFNTGLASNTFGNAFARDLQGKQFRLGGLTGALGQGAGITGQAQSNDTALTGAMADNRIGLGDARASAAIQRGNIWGNTINGINSSMQRQVGSLVNPLGGLGNAFGGGQQSQFNVWPGGY